jgi:streptogramin lyase
MWANTATDTDFIAEPLAGGLGTEFSWQLRSEQSPESNALVFTLPANASLRMSTSVPGGAEVVMEDRTLYLIPPASAKEADGESLPVSYTIAGDTLTTHVSLTGNVDFPVLVDPEVSVVDGYYGEAGGDNQWQNWHTASNCGGFGFPAYDNLIQTGTNPNQPVNCYGEWFIGVTTASTVRITRVDVSNVTHSPANQSSLQIGIWDSNGSEIWSANGYAGASGTAPLVTAAAYSNAPMAFCADGAGGHDGNKEGEQPLCNECKTWTAGACTEPYGGTEFYMMDDLWESQTVYNYAQLTSATIRYVQATAPSLASTTSEIATQWVGKAKSPFVQPRATETGTGIAAIGLDYASGYREAYTNGSHGEKEMPVPGSSPAPETAQYDPACDDPFCPNEAWAEGRDMSGLSTGIWTLGAWARNPVDNYGERVYTMYVDKTPPVIETPSWSGATFADGPHALGFSAQDGSSAAPQSGTRLIHVYIDGRYVSNDLTTCPEPIGGNVIPSSSCFGLSGSWTLNSEDYGAGPHSITIWAEDWAGNTSERTFTVTINHPVSNTVKMGPGALNLRTGEYELGATDVSVAAGAADLAVSRSYSTQPGPASPLGPGWELSLPDSSASGQWQSLEVLPTGAVEATPSGEEEKVLFTPKSGGGYQSPTGFQNYTLTGQPATDPTSYRITNSGGDYTEFAKPTGESVFVPTTAGQDFGLGGVNKVTYVTSEEHTSEVLGPPPAAGDSCTPEHSGQLLEHPEYLPKGCRALSFSYAKETTAGSGEAASEWGNYKGQLTHVYFTAWNVAESKMTTVAVAQYLYDHNGRLRAEWNPQIEPEREKCAKEPFTHGCLVTTYGYNSEGLLTAMTPPGQQPWVFTYGTTAGEPNARRLFKVTRAQPKSGAKEEEVQSVLKEQKEVAKNTATPKITGSTVVGVRMAVSTGSWSNSPVAYAFQWQDCNSTGGACVPIAGATNANYTTVSSDVGHTLVATVTATNGAGSFLASSPASAVVTATAGSYTQKVASGSMNAVSCIAGTTDCIVSDSAGKVFYATNVSSSSPATWTGWYGPEEDEEEPSQAVDCPSSSLCLLAAGKESAGGNLFYATSFGGSWKEAYSPSYGVDAIACASSAFCIDGQDGDGYFRYATTPASTSWTLEDQGSTSMRGAFCLTTSFCALADGTGHVHIATSTSQIESASWKETDVDGTSKLNGISCTATTSCVAVDGAGNALKLTIESSGAATAVKHDIDGTTSLAAVTCSGTSTCVAVDASGNIFVSKNAGETWTKEYALGDKLTSVACASTTLCATTDTTGNVTSCNPAGATTTQGELHSPQAGSTVEYNVPLSGSEGSYLQNLTKSEVEKWGETDPPSEADAILAPDAPQTWPATNYRRASIFYYDSTGRLVNTANPAGGVATRQYNSYDTIASTLTPSNRVRALEAGSESAAKAELLETKNSYAEEGALLESSTGPQREIKLQGGSTELARAHTVYHYDEGAPKSEEPYRLVTKTTEGALLTNGEEKEVHTVTTSYSGQSELGWQLRKPTSITTEPASGQRLTRTTTYSPETGDVTETGAPAQAPPISEYSPSSASGPLRITSGSDGNLWFTENNKAKIGKITPSGTITEYTIPGGGTPWAIAAGADKNLWFTEASSNKVSKITTSGSVTEYAVPSGSSPEGIAAGSDGNLWFADYGTSKVGKITTAGVVTEYALPAGSDPYEIASGSDGNLWFTESGTNKIGKITTSGAITEYALPSGSSPHGITSGSDNNLWFADYGTNKIGKITPSGTITEYGLSSGTGPYGITAGSNKDLWFTSYKGNRVGSITTSGVMTEYALPAESGPAGVTSGPEGDLWVAFYGSSKIASLIPVTNGEVHTSQTVYYSAGTESGVTECNNHPEWANLPCETRAGKQPEKGAPLPVTTLTYNMWDAPVTTTETSGSSKRTTTDTYEPGGQLKESSVSSSVGRSVPTETNEYNEGTGELTKQSAGGKSISRVVNTLGQVVSYADATGTTSIFEYEAGGDDRLTHTSDGKGTQTYGYSTTTGELTSLEDSAAGDFSAQYNVEGQPASETYPNGMTATYTDNATGAPTAVSYTKGSTTLYQDQVVPSIHGQWLTQTSTLMKKESYAYDGIDRLTEAQEEPVGKGCTTEVYAYDPDSERASETKREVGTGESCTSEGGTTTSHGYDEAGRLSDTGTEYEPFGAITKLPAADAGGYTVESAYYANGALYSQTQHEHTNTYLLDPQGRALETTNTKGLSSVTTVSHYSGSGSGPSWTETTSGTWTRDIRGINGVAVATQSSTEVLIKIMNLHGDVVGTIPDNAAAETATLTSEPTAFGVPTSTGESKSTWLGGSGLQSELESGIISGPPGSYVPQIGLNLEPTGLTGMAAQDPVNEYGGGQGEAETGSESTGSLPGAIHPLPVNLQIEKEFWANPPWGKPAVNDPLCKMGLSMGNTTSSTGRKWIYARAELKCGGDTLPIESELEACLEGSSPYVPINFAECDTVEAGEGSYSGPTSTLKAHVHYPCESEIDYRGRAWFWIPGMKEGREVLDFDPACGVSVPEEVLTLALAFVEVFEGLQVASEDVGYGDGAG